LRLLVTHDPLDAAVLADRLVIIEEGQVVQRGTFAEVAARPRSRYVAELVGVNLLRGTAHGGLLDLPGGGTLAASDAPAGSALAVVHPRSVALHRGRPEGSPRNVNEGPVESIELLGDRVRVRVGGRVPLVAEITPSALRELQLAEGAMVWTSVKATDIDVYAA
jgi:molybdate transport system ATP-binding protein